MTAERAADARVRTVFLGSGGFGRASLRRLHGDDAIRLVAVVTAPPRPAGRRQQITTTLIHDTAADLGIATILTPERLRAPDSIAAVLALEPELLVLADYGQIIPAELLGLRHGALNLHPSLLPRHRGATPIPAAILAGDAETGVTLMRMDAGLDTGPIVAQERLALDGTETTPRLEAALELVAAELLDRTLGSWIRDELEPHAQFDTGATLTRPLRREDGRLDPRISALDLERRVRAHQPWPGSFFDTAHGRLLVWRTAPLSTPVDQPAEQPVGTLTASGLATGDGLLALDSVQPAGGRRMSWTDYLRGHPDIVGSRVVPGS